MDNRRFYCYLHMQICISAGRLLRAAVLGIWAGARPVSAASFAAWWTSRGPSVALQDPWSQPAIAYSLCNATHDTVVPRRHPYFFQGTDNALPGTSLAVAGWVDKTGTLWASVFYQTRMGDIVNVQYSCNNETGQYENPVVTDILGHQRSSLDGRRRPSSPRLSAMVPTRLAAALIEETDDHTLHPDMQGLFLFYLDPTQAVQMLHAPGRPPLLSWGLDRDQRDQRVQGSVTTIGIHAADYALAASVTVSPALQLFQGSLLPRLRLVSVSEPGDGLQLSTQQPDGSWTTVVLSVPTTEWSGLVGSLGLTETDGAADGTTEPVVFYAANDSMLHAEAISPLGGRRVPLLAVNATDRDGDETEWWRPAREDRKGSVHFGMAVGEADLWVYYQAANGSLMEAHGQPLAMDHGGKAVTREGYVWQASLVKPDVLDGIVPTTTATRRPSSSLSSSSSSPASPSSSSSSPLPPSPSSGCKGSCLQHVLAICVALAAAAVLALAAMICFWVRHRRRQKQHRRCRQISHPIPMPPAPKDGEDIPQTYSAMPLHPASHPIINTPPPYSKDQGLELGHVTDATRRRTALPTTTTTVTAATTEGVARRTAKGQD